MLSEGLGSIFYWTGLVVWAVIVFGVLVIYIELFQSIFRERRESRSR